MTDIIGFKLSPFIVQIIEAYYNLNRRPLFQAHGSLSTALIVKNLPFPLSVCLKTDAHVSCIDTRPWTRLASQRQYSHAIAVPLACVVVRGHLRLIHPVSSLVLHITKKS